MEYRKCSNSNSKNDNRLRVGASAFLKSVDFRAFAVNVKTIAPSQKLYQSGHAIWWYDMPMPVYSFLDEYDLSGKTIIPFCTNGGSGFSISIDEIQSLEPKATVINEGLAVSHTDMNNYTVEDVQKWLETLDIGIQNEK